jgi:hypothetical protein
MNMSKHLRIFIVLASISFLPVRVLAQFQAQPSPQQQAMMQMMQQVVQNMQDKGIDP